MRVQTYMCPLVAALLAVVLTYVGSVVIGVVSVSSGVACDTVSWQMLAVYVRFVCTSNLLIVRDRND